MRLQKEKAEFLSQEIRKILPDAKVYLFGSRADDNQKGGDIDILVIGKRELSFREKSKIRIIFWKNFGEQKIDIATFTEQSNDNFKKVALLSAIEL
jgi:uncharacterized protein